MSKRTLKPVELNLDEPGKDLSRMFAASLSGGAEARQAVMLPVTRLVDNPYQPRLKMDEASLDELARVIEGQGFQGVLVARPHPRDHEIYQLTAGHRRREAAKRAGLTTLPVVVQDLSNEEMVTLAITENIQREDLTPLEEGRIYLLMSEEMGYTLEQMSKEIGKRTGYIYNRLRAAKAPDDVQALVQDKPDSLRAVANLIKVKDPAERAEIIGRLLDGRMTTDDLPSYIKALAAERPSRPASAGLPDASLSAPTIPLATFPPLQLEKGTAGTTYGERSRTEDNLVARRGDADTRDSIEHTSLPADSSAEAQPPSEVVVERGTVLVDGIQVPVERKQHINSRNGGAANLTNAEARAVRAGLRARHSRISRALGLILSINDGLGDDETLSEEERLELATISVVAEQICLRFGIRKDG